MKKQSPGSTGSLILGILSILLAAIPFVGHILGLVAIFQYRMAKRLANQQPEEYQAGGIATAGFVCGIVGFGLATIALLQFFAVWKIWHLYIIQFPGVS
jgi:hypothetical protein